MEDKLRDLRRRAMFYLGYTTEQVAKAEGVTKNTMADWRRCRNIEPNLFLGEYKGPREGNNDDILC